MDGNEHLLILEQGREMWNEWQREHQQIRPLLRGVNLCGADLTVADFAGANLRGAVLNAARLIEANLRGADLREAELVSIDLNGADLGLAVSGLFGQPTWEILVSDDNLGYLAQPLNPVFDSHQLHQRKGSAHAHQVLRDNFGDTRRRATAAIQDLSERFGQD